MNEHFEIFKDIDISISTEDYVSIYNKSLIEDITQLVDKMIKDKELNLTNDQYFYIKSYKDIITNIEKNISKLFNINLHIVPNDKLAVYIDDKNKDSYDKVINNFIKGNKINVDSSLKDIEYSSSRIHGKKFKTDMNVYLGVNLNNMVFVDKLSPEDISKNILTLINTLYSTESKKNEMITLTKNIVSGFHKGDSLDTIYNKYIDNSTDISEYSDKKKVLAIMNGIVSKATDENNENNKLSILVRINYLILLVTLLIIIYTAISTPALGISIVTLLVYNILLYLYKLGVKIFTGNKDPLNENFTNADVSSMIEKDKGLNNIKKLIKDKFSLTNMFKGNDEDFSIDNISKATRI